MSAGRGSGRFRSATTGRITAALLTAGVTFLHYNTAVHIHEAHGIYRRLYYFPIVIGAVLDGWRGGLIASLVVCGFYIPHAFGYIGYDPAPTLEKILEMILYVAIGLLAGVLSGREKRALGRWRATAAGLQTALDEKAAMQEELQRSAALAAVGRLSAGLAHEIRNPLASITGAVDILSDDFDEAHPKRRFLDVLRRESRRLNEVLTRFLDFARPRHADRQKIDLGRLLDETVTGLQLQPQMPQFKVIPSPSDCPIHADGDQIRQLLLNLLLNAAQAAGDGGQVSAQITCGDRGPLLEIRDDGPGFSPEALENYGTPFFTTREGGTGLGLAICQRICENHGARLLARNADTGGAIVTLAFEATE